MTLRKSSPIVRPPSMMVPAFVVLLIVGIGIPAAHAENDCGLFFANGNPVSITYVVPSANGGEDLLDTSPPGYLYYTFTTSKVKNAQITDTRDFITLNLNERTNTLDILTGSKFKYLEETETETTLHLPFTLTCNTETTIDGVLVIYLIDKNNHAPQLKNDVYVYTLPMPFPPEVSLTGCMGDAITGREVDITTTKLTAWIQDDVENVFSVGAVEWSSEEEKDFSIQISLASQVRFEEEKHFILMITLSSTLVWTFNPPGIHGALDLLLTTSAPLAHPLSFTNAVPHSSTGSRLADRPSTHHNVAKPRCRQQAKAFRESDHGTRDDEQEIDHSVGTIVIKPNRELSSFPPQFSTPLNVKEVTEGQETTGDLLQLDIKNVYDDDLIYILSSRGSGEDAAKFFDVSGRNNVVTVKWKDDNTEEELNQLLEQNFAILLLEARNEALPDDAQSGFTVIHITLPGPGPEPTTTPEPCLTTVTPTDCPVCTEMTTTVCPTESTTEIDCSACPTTTPDPETTSTSEPCLTTVTPTDCPLCPDTTTVCPVESTTEIDCSVCNTEPTNPGDTTTLEPCLTTVTPTDCPLCTDTTTVCPTETTTVIVYTDCPTETTDPGNTTPCDCTSTLPPESTSTTPPDCSGTPSECTPTPPGTTECDCSCESPNPEPTDPSNPSNTPPTTTICPDFDISTMCPSDATPPTTNPSTCDCTTITTPTDVPSTTPDCPGSTDPSVTNGPGVPTTTPRECDCAIDCANFTTDCPPVSTDPSVTDDPGSTASSPSDCDCTSTLPTDCPSILPTDCPTTCPTDTPIYPTTSNPEPDLQFEQSMYNARVLPNTDVGIVIAAPKVNKEDKAVEFSLEEVVSSPSGALEINSATGVVTLVNPLEVGNHQYRLVATAGGERATAWLTVEVPWQCKDEEDVVVFEDAVAIWHVDEMSPVTLTPKVIESHQCTIEGEGDDKAYFTVNSETGVVDMRPVDRESEVFNGEDYPTLHLWLRALCDADESTLADGATNHAPTLSDVADGGKVNRVLNSPRQSLIRVVIQDINDNEPKFNPAQMTLGYPDSTLAEIVRPSSLFTAEATDADLGLNAELRYSLDETGAQAFAVHPETGVVYPLRDATLPGAGLTFTVIARDLAGADDGHSGTLQVTVVPLSEVNLVEARVNDNVLENVPELLRELSAASGHDLRSLSASVLPGTAAQTRVRRNDPGPSPAADDTAAPATTLRLLLYSLQDGVPVQGSVFQKDLSNALVDWNGTAEAPSLVRDGGGEDCDNTGLLVATIILSILLGSLLIAIGVIFGLREYKKRWADTISKKSLVSVETSADSNIVNLTEDSLKKHDSIFITESDDSPIAGSSGSPYESWKSPELEVEEAEEKEKPETVVAPSSTLLLTSIELPRPTISLGATSHDTESGEYEEIAAMDDLTPGSTTSDAGSADDDFKARATRKKSGVTFNEAVDCIEVERL